MQTKYIPCPEYHLNFSIVNTNAPGYCTPITKFPIEKIKFNRKYLSFANPVREEDVNCIVNDFYIDAWEPIFLNPKNYLIDGQHRLAAAKRLGLEFMDVVIIDEEKGK
ncbi:MAG: hypothetical protein ACYCVH_03250 [Ignavibacteriaceae bacterium]